ncbi:MAG TPA: hypothetical protein VLK66_07535 [Longimicrobium sp.]|nr:hypothetical protein [Longimicrobium sp.]
MVSNSAVTSVALLRQALRDEIAATSLRHVSRQVGMSPTGLQKFLESGHPLTATRRRVERWYVLHGPGRLESGLTAESAMAVLRVLVQDLSPARHRPTLEALVKSLEEAYRTARLPQPGWLGEVRAAVGGVELE